MATKDVEVGEIRISELEQLVPGRLTQPAPEGFTPEVFWDEHEGKWFTRLVAVARVSVSRVFTTKNQGERGGGLSKEARRKARRQERKRRN